MQRTWKPTTAGIMTVIAGAIGIGRGVFVLVLGGILGKVGALTEEFSDLINQWVGMIMPGMTDFPEFLTKVIGMSSTLLIVIGAIMLAFGIVALVGGIQALRRRRWGLALAGAILSLPCAIVLGILSIIFVSLGRDEFASAEEGEGIIT